MKKKNFGGTLKVGDVVTGYDLLGSQENEPGELAWLRGSESPFGMDVLDCRSFALHHVSTTASPAIAESFSRNSKSDGTEFIGKLPQNAVEAKFEYTFPFQKGLLNRGPAFVSTQMEDKWNVYFFDGILYFARSWTGALNHIARCEINGSSLVTKSVMTNKEFIDERDFTFPLREVFFLIVSHVLGTVYPHPVPAFIEMDDEKIALYSFSQYGRRGLFASRADVPRSSHAA